MRSYGVVLQRSSIITLERQNSTPAGSVDYCKLEGTCKFGLKVAY